MSDSPEAAFAAVRQLADACAEVLQAGLVSAILHGSLTQDDFRPGQSDLDLLLVVDKALTSGQSDALVSAVVEADLGPADGVDLIVITHRTAAAPGERPGRELLVGRWGVDSKAEIERRREDVSDLWPELSEARLNGRSLLGARPRDVLGEVPVARVRANSIGWLRAWLGLTDDAENAVHMVLTACRMWRFELTGQHLSKTAAARWALERDPSLSGVELALTARVTSQPQRIAPHEIETVLLRVLSDLEQQEPA
jgi:predicted nucleotidyltransferase